MHAVYNLIEPVFLRTEDRVVKLTLNYQVIQLLIVVAFCLFDWIIVVIEIFRENITDIKRIVSLIVTYSYKKTPILYNISLVKPQVYVYY